MKLYVSLLFYSFPALVVLLEVHRLEFLKLLLIIDCILLLVILDYRQCLVGVNNYPLDRDLLP